jgi:predicted nucleic acid-binding protein
VSLPRIVVDNSAIIPAYLPEDASDSYDAGLVTNRARALVRAIRLRRVNAYVPPSFFREFLNVIVARIGQSRDRQLFDQAREHWEDLLDLRLNTVPLKDLLPLLGPLTFDDFCPPADSWYVAAAMQTTATFWISHEHSDGLVEVARRHITVRLLSVEAPDF